MEKALQPEDDIALQKKEGKICCLCEQAEMEFKRPVVSCENCPQASNKIGRDQKYYVTPCGYYNFCKVSALKKNYCCKHISEGRGIFGLPSTLAPLTPVSLDTSRGLRSTVSLMACPL